MNGQTAKRLRRETYGDFSSQEREVKMKPVRVTRLVVTKYREVGNPFTRKVEKVRIKKKVKTVKYIAYKAECDPLRLKYKRKKKEYYANKNTEYDRNDN